MTADPGTGRQQEARQQARTAGHPQESDRTFFGRFVLVVIGLHAVVLGFAAIAFMLGRTDENPVRQRTLAAENTAPVAVVVTSAAELRERAADVELPARRGEVAPRAPAGTAGAEQVVQQFCAACHDAGVLDAPKSHDVQAWKQRMVEAGGVDGLVESAIRGKNQMPPRGGAPQLTDAQIRAAVELMRRADDQG